MLSRRRYQRVPFPALAFSGMAWASATMAQSAGPGLGITDRIASFRSDTERLRSNVEQDEAGISSVESQRPGLVSEYLSAVSSIDEKLGAGTTPGNPELVTQWQQAQSDLVKLDGAIGNLSAASGHLAEAAALAAYLDTSIHAAAGLPGANDSQHQELLALGRIVREASTSLKHLSASINHEIEAQSIAVGDERRNLLVLRHAIEIGAPLGSSLANAGGSRLAALRAPAPALTEVASLPPPSTPSAEPPLTPAAPTEVASAASPSPVEPPAPAPVAPTPQPQPAATPTPEPAPAPTPAEPPKTTAAIQPIPPIQPAAPPPAAIPPAAPEPVAPIPQAQAAPVPATPALQSAPAAPPQMTAAIQPIPPIPPAAPAPAPTPATPAAEPAAPPPSPAVAPAPAAAPPAQVAMLPPPPPAGPPPAERPLPHGAPLFVVDSGQAIDHYESRLYESVGKLLDRKPDANIEIFAVYPAADAADSATAQQQARAIADALNAFGIPSDHVSVSSSTDAGSKSSEVRLYTP